VYSAILPHSTKIKKGKTPVLRTALQMCVNGEIINGAVSFIMRLEISLYPHVFLVPNDLIIFSFS